MKEGAASLLLPNILHERRQMASISLPKLPRGKAFEEFVSAFFQCDGYYIERNIIERKVEEVLELDIITTNYDVSPPDISLLEAKSGEWGFPDLFKVRGWMDYLGIAKGIFIASKERRSIEFYAQIAQALNIHLIVIPDLSQYPTALAEFLRNDNIDRSDIVTWRYSYWIERSLMRQLNRRKKTLQDKKCFKALESYYFQVNSGIFFTENIIRRLTQLYSTFQKFPRISAKCANELIGNPFDEEYDAVPEPIFNDTYYKCSYNDIQISTFIEHRARLAILKSAIDFKLYKEADVKARVEATSKVGGVKFDLLHLVPTGFRQGLETISGHRHCHRYPVFWQWFMWVFGSFILKDYEEEEYAILSERTGIPIEEIPDALKSYQILFPREDGWFVDLSPNSRITKLGGIHTLHDLMRWNNLAVTVLEKEV
jgi:hypothetical protein